MKIGIGSQSRDLKADLGNIQNISSVSVSVVADITDNTSYGLVSHYVTIPRGGGGGGTQV